MAQTLADFFLRVIQALLGLIADYPLASACVVGFVVCWVMISKAVRSRSQKKQNVAKDPTRMYSSADRADGFGRTGGRCEFDGWFVLNRCHRPASHGDHWRPWSTGGATTMGNFVSACVRCNTSKGAKVPTFGQTARVTWRRRFYFPRSLDRRPGERFTG